MMTIVHYTIKRYLREKDSLIEMLIMPIVLVFILGTALNGMFEPGNMDKLKVAYIHMDKGHIGTDFDTFLKSKDVNQFLDVQYVQTVDEGRELLDKREVSAVFLMEENSTERFLAGTNVSIDIYSSGQYPFEETIIKNITENFTQGVNAANAMIALGETNPDLVFDGRVQGASLHDGTKNPKAIDYYAVTMLVMIIMFGALYGSYGISEDYIGVIGARLRSTTVSPFELYVGKSVANVLIVYFQSILLLIFTMLIFNVNWGTNIPLLLLIMLLSVILSTGLGAIIGILFKNIGAVTGLINILVIFSTFVAGGFFKITNDSFIFSILQHMSPNYLIQKTIFNTIYEAPLIHTIQYILILGAIIFVIYSSVAISLRRRSA